MLLKNLTLLLKSCYTNATAFVNTPPSDRKRLSGPRFSTHAEGLARVFIRSLTAMM